MDFIDKEEVLPVVFGQESQLPSDLELVVGLEKITSSSSGSRCTRNMREYFAISMKQVRR